MGRRRRAKRNQLFEKGLLALVIGCGMLVMPLILAGSPILKPVALGLRTPAWVAIGIGLMLLIGDAVIKRRSRVEDTSDLRPASTQTPRPDLEWFTERAPQRGSQRSKGVPSTELPRESGRRSSWGKQVFDGIEWRRFEAVCERLFGQAGFETRSQSHGADGGIDIWLHSRNSQGPAAVVQCKHWVGRAVGVKEVREFFGVMASKSMKRGTFATSSTFTPAAVDFAKENGINLLDGDGLLALIARRSAAQQQELLDVAYEGEYWRPTCASCGVKLVERVASNDSSRFWGCVNFPRCRTRMAARTT